MLAKTINDVLFEYLKCWDLWGNYDHLVYISTND